MQDENKPLTLILPIVILYNDELSFNDKLIYALHNTYRSKKGKTYMTNIEIGKLLCLHPNIISSSHQRMIKAGYLVKEGRATIAIVDDFLKEMRKRHSEKNNVVIPYEVYHTNLKPGAKLLWAEYNIFRNTELGYIASREYTAERINASVSSVSNWTIELNDNGFFEKYRVNYQDNGSQRIVRTKKFTREKTREFCYPCLNSVFSLHKKRTLLKKRYKK